MEGSISMINNRTFRNVRTRTGASYRRFFHDHNIRQPTQTPTDVEELVLARSIQETGPVWKKRATRESIKALSAVKVREELEAGDSCVICLEEYEQDKDQDRIASLPCKHAFHRNCVAGWLDNSHICPLCCFEMPAELIQISTSSSHNPNPNPT